MARLTGSYRHVGSVGDQRGTIHQRVAGLRVDQLGELFQNLRHLIAALAAADINDDIRIGPLCNLVLGHGLTCTESAGNGRRAALGDREERIQDTLTGQQRLARRETALCGTRNPDRPFL